MALSRAAAVTLPLTGLVTTGVGLWWHGAATSEAPGMVRYAAVAVGASLLGGLILWHRPRNRYGQAHLAVGVLFGATVLAVGALASPLPAVPGQLALAWSWGVLAALLPLWVFVIAAFPDGRFHRRALGRATVTLGVVVGLLATASYLLYPAGETLPLIRLTTQADLAGPLAGLGGGDLYRMTAGAGAVLGTTAPLVAVVALADRYRHSGVVVRQQIKWLLAGATVSVLLQTIPVQALDSEALRTLAGVLVVLAVPLPLVAAAVAVFKYGLWEIDVVISHGLVYAIVSGVLSLLFVTAALAAGVSVAGPDVRVVAALGLALLVSYLARPLRRRLVSLVARALFGEGPRGVLAFSRLADGAGVRDAVGQGTRIAEVARSALGAPWAQVWLYLRAEGSGDSGGSGGALRPLAGSGGVPLPSVVVPEHAEDALTALSGGRRVADVPPGDARWLEHVVSDGEDVVAAMVVGGDLLGLLACGARPRDPYGDEDLELLAALARESALSLQNLRLEGELRQRLAQIEAQASELRRSRERLVTAQDKERRRIERDLHDGAQQQLVLLAARLRRLATAAHSESADELTDLADEAEDAVFTLQELARGIYPSLLADKGLHAALQAHAARLPVHVRVEMGPGLFGRRLSPELEALFYYVALEATTNALKHAPGAGISVSLRTGERPRAVVLEVHDDGPGFDTRAPRGSGVQNMADRVAAVGGVFSIESAAGAGTWVRAEVLEPATVTPLRSAEASP